ncbi:GGDEF domain-containing protein [Corticibacterium sp. UT-5YL-CI-8]|nr:GGDEF domain-containing protein [Tianweitania sp. UT-5YL-CI-8]
MATILLKASAVAVLSVLVSLLLAVTIVPALGGVVDGNAWLMCIVCPLLIAWPASAFTFWQSARLKAAHRELARAHAQLAAAHRRLAEKARRDEMTGMLNRETFFAMLDDSRRKTDRGVLLIVDADHFKRINDTYGHLTGDTALRLVSDAIKRGVRGGDLLGRIGGEEFGVLLAGASAEEAAQVAERIRMEVERIRFKPDDEKVLTLTVSIGGAVCGADAAVSDVMRQADQALYEAKNSGRNRVAMANQIAVAA